MKTLTTPRMERCIGCHSCSLACARLVHGRISWDTAGIRIKSSGGLSTGFEARVCVACDPAYCAQACPTGAMTQRRGGGVIVKKKLCIRCGECARACPVDAIHLGPFERALCLHPLRPVRVLLPARLPGTGGRRPRETGIRQGGVRMSPSMNVSLVRDHFRVLVADLGTGRSSVEELDGREDVAGGSGLAALLFGRYGLADQPWDHPDQPLILAVGPLTGLYPLMSKTVAAFKSPYHDQYTESHAGGRSALCLAYAGYDALVVRGRAAHLSCLCVGSQRVEQRDVRWMAGWDALKSGKSLRKMFPGSGHRSILRVGPAGENGSAMACINVDTYRHFGRMGGGGVMGSKNLKAVVLLGDGVYDAPGGKEYAKLFQQVHTRLTDTDMMRKYHDLGTAGNVAALNELKSLPWRNLQQTTDPDVGGISGESFAEKNLLRNMACAGCPVGCIHIGYVREKFQEDHRFFYRQVSYDYELIFALGSMLGVTEAAPSLMLMDRVEKTGLDAMSAGVALAWAAEALEKGVVTEEQTLLPLKFGDAENFEEALDLLAGRVNEFWSALAMGVPVAAARFGGGDFACVLGQEMAGYATGEVFFTSQSMGFRHSHLDAGRLRLGPAAPGPGSGRGPGFPRGGRTQADPALLHGLVPVRARHLQGRAAFGMPGQRGPRGPGRKAGRGGPPRAGAALGHALHDRIRSGGGVDPEAVQGSRDLEGAAGRGLPESAARILCGAPP